jgi:hypothetical protein
MSQLAGYSRSRKRNYTTWSFIDYAGDYVNSRLREAYGKIKAP